MANVLLKVESKKWYLKLLIIPFVLFLGLMPIEMLFSKYNSRGYIPDDIAIWPFFIFIMIGALVALYPMIFERMHIIFYEEYIIINGKKLEWSELYNLNSSGAVSFYIKKDDDQFEQVNVVVDQKSIEAFAKLKDESISDYFYRKWEMAGSPEIKIYSDSNLSSSRFLVLSMIASFYIVFSFSSMLLLLKIKTIRYYSSLFYKWEYAFLPALVIAIISYYIHKNYLAPNLVKMSKKYMTLRKMRLRGLYISLFAVLTGCSGPYFSAYNAFVGEQVKVFVEGTVVDSGARGRYGGEPYLVIYSEVDDDYYDFVVSFRIRDQFPIGTKYGQWMMKGSLGEYYSRK